MCHFDQREKSFFLLPTQDIMPAENRYYVYLLTNWNHRVMYVGVTNDLVRRIYEHKNKLVKGFTEKYNVNKLVYFEETGDVRSALTREKEIKKWRREKKNALVIGMNPEWKDSRRSGERFLPAVEMTEWGWNPRVPIAVKFCF